MSAITNLSELVLARRVCRYLGEILFAIVERDGSVPPVRAKMGTWTVGQFVVAQEDERRRCRRPDLCEVSGTRGVR